MGGEGHRHDRWPSYIMTEKQKQRTSLFNHRIDVDGESLLFNAFTGNMVCVTGSLNNIIDFDIDQRRRLAQLGFIVDSTPEDELKSVVNALGASSRRMYLVFTVATKCDLKCSYCFENREKRSVMSLETLDLSLRWVEEQFAKGRFSDLSVIIFGGEPLLVPNQLMSVLKGLTNIREKHNICKGPILLTTNALIGDSFLFQQLCELGVTQIQVTFDGDASVTNSRRKSLRITDVYHETLARLPMLAGLSELTIKLNFSPKTVESIPRFMDDLSCVPGLKDKNFRIKPEPIVRYQSGDGEMINPSEEFGSNDIRLAKSFDLICRSAEERKIEIDRSAIFNTPCMAFRESSYLLEPNGSLRSCISAFGMDSFSVGNVRTGADHIGQSLARSQRVKDLKTCVEDGCAYLPMCGGGCPYEKEFVTGKANGLLCRYDYFMSALPVFVGSAWRTANHKLFLLS